MPGRGDAPELRFLRECLLALGSVRHRLPVTAREVRDWGRVVERARGAWVAGQVWAGLVVRGASNLVPEPERSLLGEIHEATTARNTLLLAEAARMQAALAASGIESLILKGPGLLVTAYPDVGSRHVGDIDLLVRQRDARRAEEVLREAGARVPGEQARYDGRVREPGETAGLGEIEFRTDQNVKLELHDRAPGGAPDGGDVEELIQRGRSVTWQGRTLRIPAAPDLAAGLCIHVFDHHAGEEKYVLRHLGDLATLVGNGHVNWGEIASRAGPAGATAVALSRELLETGATGRTRLLRHALRSRAGHWRTVLAGREPAPGNALRVLFPSRTYMATRYGVAPGSGLLPLLYLWRPIAGAWRFLRGG